MEPPRWVGGSISSSVSSSSAALSYKNVASSFTLEYSEDVRMIAFPLPLPLAALPPIAIGSVAVARLCHALHIPPLCRVRSVLRGEGRRETRENWKDEDGAPTATTQPHGRHSSQFAIAVRSGHPAGHFPSYRDLVLCA